ncbi:hypothetical protein EK904_007753 [Melospiza melodia maxima]|nr:hypothetical protein EK904_007753 [Melospiza melodia maxima]
MKRQLELSADKGTAAKERPSRKSSTGEIENIKLFTGYSLFMEIIFPLLCLLHLAHNGVSLLNRASTCHEK